jgi:hypothetical protein
MFSTTFGFVPQKLLFSRLPFPAENRCSPQPGRSAAHPFKQIFKFSKITRAEALSDIPSSGQSLL